MKEKSITVFAPATVSNLNCGFDILGFAIEQPGDEITLTLNGSKHVTIESILGDGGQLPFEPKKNTASAVVKLYLEQLKINQGVAIAIHKKMPLNSGLGSSAASSVAALVGINQLMGAPMSRTELLPLAMEGERLACGNAHADNVAPALFGGLILIRSYNPLEVISLPVPQNLWCVVIHPAISIPTREARQILPLKIPLTDAVIQWGNVAGLIAGFYTENFDLIGRSLTDVIVEPVRAGLIPLFYEMKTLAKSLNVIGFGISGSGPSVFAFCHSEKQSQDVCEKLSNLLHAHSVNNQHYISKINTTGAVVIG